MFVTRSCHGRPQADAGDAHASTKFTDIFCIFKEEVIHRASDGKCNVIFVIHYFKSICTMAWELVGSLCQR